MKARLLFRRKHVYPDGAMYEMKGWVVPNSERTPEGFKYSMAYLDVWGRRLLCRDNAHGKGHHRHEGSVETSVEFISMEKLVEDFLREVDILRGLGL